MFIYNNRAIFLENISYFEIIDNKIVINYRKVIKQDNFELDFSGNQFDEILKKEKITYIKKIGKYYFNTKKILYIEILKTSPETKQISIRLVFDVDYIDMDLSLDYWKIWRTSNNILL